MFLEKIGAFLLVLVVVFILGNLWFHFIEGILKWVKKLFIRHKQTPTWHTLPLMRMKQKMLDIDEIRKRAQQASERASDAMKKALEKARSWLIKSNFRL